MDKLIHCLAMFASIGLISVESVSARDPIYKRIYQYCTTHTVILTHRNLKTYGTFLSQSGLCFTVAHSVPQLQLPIRNNTTTNGVLLHLRLNAKQCITCETFEQLKETSETVSS